MKKIAIVLLVSILLCFTLGSCSFIDQIKQELNRLTDFVMLFAELLEDPTVEKAEALIHPSSSLTAEEVVQKILDCEKLEQIKNIDPDAELSMSETSEPRITFNDPTLGGNLYEMDCEITVGDITLSLTLNILSTDEGFGIYDFDIK